MVDEIRQQLTIGSASQVILSRVLLGLLTLSLLIPALLFTISDEPGRSAGPSPYQDEMSLAAGSESSMSIGSNIPSSSHEHAEAAGSSTPSTSASSETHDQGHEPPTEGSDGAAATGPPTADAGEDTTTPQSEDEHEPGEVQSSGTITGDACPCQVTGTVELKGSISLGGDLIVDGGTLVARSGVALRGNGHQIMFMNGGSADFQGSPTSTWSGDGSNANLSRDVVFDGLARIMWHEGAGPSTLRFVRVTNSGVQEKLGFYPLHWHLNGNSVRGTLVEGVVVDKAKNHAFVPHGSHGIRFKDTIAHTVVREAYWWDSGDISNDITYDHVLAVNVVYPRSLGDLPLHHRMSAFHLGKGTGNVVANSVARNTSGGADCSGFHWPEADHGVWTFRNNSAYGGSCNGIFVWQNDSLPHVIAGFNGNLALEHGAYGNVYKFFDVDVPEIEVHALGRCHNDSCSSQGEVLFQGGSVDQVVESKHVLVGGPVRFRNMTIGSFVKNPSPGNAGVFFFEKTTLSCSNIVGSGPSTIIIDGNTC